MTLAAIVATSAAVAATSSRKEKTRRLADLLADLDPDEVEPAAAILVGEPRQGRIGVGWSTLARVATTPADSPSITITDLDDALTAVAATTGPGSSARRDTLLGDLLARATAAEDQFLRSLLGGELRQGALGGLMAEAIAKAASVPATAVRRAAMLSGNLAHTARLAITEGRPALDAVGLEVLRAVQPMLATTSPSVHAAIEELGVASVEWKLDGIRVQVHRRDDDIRIFTRNLNDV
ncbi:MAG: ATP-dependent DNA ligase, partial [Acidimicrobiia bacterium]|nr:ATP-dependent DNA ligase [Acidimicrobiia bacterium]